MDEGDSFVDVLEEIGFDRVFEGDFLVGVAVGILDFKLAAHDQNV